MGILAGRYFNASKVLRGSEPNGELLSDSNFLKNTLKVAWPAAVESFFNALAAFVDTIMVGSLGTSAIAAVGLTNQPKWIALAMFISINVALSAVVARRKGEDNREAANRTFRQVAIITLVLAAVICTVCVVFARAFMLAAGAIEGETLDQAVSYYRIIMGGGFFMIFNMMINAAQRGVGNTKIAMRTNLCANAVNVVLNYLLIGGNLGFPALGIKGAAIATVTGTAVGCIMAFASIMPSGSYLSLKFKMKKPNAFDKKTMSSVFKVGSSTFVEQIFIRTGFLLFAMIIAKLGTTEFAAHQIGMNVITISFAFADGLSASSVTLVGQSLGQKRPDFARVYVSFCQKLGFICSLVLSILFVTLNWRIFWLFTQDDKAVLDYGKIIMPLTAIIVFLQIAQVICAGALRGAGDTKYTAFVSLISIAIMRPVSGYIFCYVIGWGLIGAWISMCFDQCIRLALYWPRVKSGKWTQIKL